MPLVRGHLPGAVVAAAAATLVIVGCADENDGQADRNAVRSVALREVPATPVPRREPAPPRLAPSKRRKAERKAAPAPRRRPAAPPRVQAAPTRPAPAPQAPGGGAKDQADGSPSRSAKPEVVECNPRCP